MQASFEPLDLGAFTTELASVFQSAFDRAGMRYEVDCPPLSAPVYVDREMWEKVVFNLLSNALKFTFDGTVSVRLREEDGHAVLRVADTGVGVAAAEIPRLFDRFHRIENVAVPVQRGQRHRAGPGPGAGRAARGHDHRREHRGASAPRSPSGSRSAAGTCRRRTWSPGAGRAPCPAAANPFLLEAMRWLPGDQIAAEAEPAVPALASARRGAGGTTAPGPRAARRRQRRHARVPAAAAAARLRGHHRDRRAGRAGSRPGQPAGHPHQRRDDAPPRRPCSWSRRCARTRAPRRSRCCCCPPGPGRRRRSRAWRRARTTTWSSPSPRPNCWPGSGPTWSSRGCAATTPAGARPCSTRCTRRSSCARRGRRRRGDQRRLHRHHGVRPGGPAVLAPRGRGGPTSRTDPEGHRMVREGLGRLMTDSKGSFTVPLIRRDGRRIWVSGSFNEVRDPEDGRRMVVGTFRDVTAEHYAVQREAALAAMGLVVSRAGSAAQVLQETLGELRRLWRAREVTAATWTGAGQVTVASTGSAAGWDALPAGLRDALAALRDQPVLTPTAGEPGGAGHQARASGGHARDLDRARLRPRAHAPRTGPCSAWSAATSARRCTAPTRPTSSARRHWRCSARSSARPGCPPGSPSATSLPPARSRSAATGTTSSSCRTGGSASWSATASGTTSARPRSWASCAAPAARCCCRTRAPARP